MFEGESKELFDSLPIGETVLGVVVCTVLVDHGEGVFTNLVLQLLLQQ